MKKLMFIGVIALFISTSLSALEPVIGEKSVGFSTALPDHKFHIGTEAAIQVVKNVDAAWADKDYNAMKKFFADTAKCLFADGRVAKTSVDFIKLVKADMEESDETWTFDYVYSVDLDPSRGGEHVQAGFTTSKKSYHEWYYVIEGKIVLWRQYTMDLKK